MIYIFGDSFSEPFDNIKWAWTNLITTNLQQEILNFSLSASGLEYSYCRFEDSRTKFLENDIVIIVLTLESRTFFSVTNPENSQITRGKLSKEEKIAYEYYLKYLENPLSNKLNILNFLHHLKDVTLEKNLHSIVLHGFPNSNHNEINDFQRFNNLYISEGNLLDDVAMVECENFQLYERVMNYNGIGDLRPNHMTKSNHYILSQKILKNIKQKTPINLKTEFYQKILNDRMLNHMITNNCDDW